MKLRYGIISTAGITERFLHAVEEASDLVQAIASRSLDKASAMADKYQIPSYYGSYEELYEDKDIDIVYIATNNATHVQEVSKALDHHLHVLCEKPIALCETDANFLFEKAKDVGCFLMEAQKSVFLPVSNDIFHIIQNKTYGRLRQVDMSSSFPNPSAAWMHDPTQGGVVYGSASYTLEYLMVLLQSPLSKVQAIGTKEINGTCDHIAMNVMIKDTLINSRITMKTQTRHHAIFYFDHAYIEVPSYWKAREYTIYKDGCTETVSYPVTYEMCYEVTHTHECIEQKLLTSPLMTPDISISCCRWVDEILKQLDESSS